MIRYFIYVVLIFFLSQCSVSLKKFDEMNNRTAAKEYLRNLNEVEEFYEEKYVGTMPTPQIEFLQRLTGIQSYSVKQFEELFMPTKDNIKAWRNWYKGNEHRLFWNEKEDKVILLDKLNN